MYKHEEVSEKRKLTESGCVLPPGLASPSTPAPASTCGGSMYNFLLRAGEATGVVGGTFAEPIARVRSHIPSGAVPLRTTCWVLDQLLRMNVATWYRLLR